MVNSTSLEFVEALYQQYLADPDALEPEWRTFFDEHAQGNGATQGFRASPSFKPSSIFNPPVNGAAASEHAVQTVSEQAAALQQRIGLLVRNYRVRGHMIARVDPLGIPKADLPELEPSYYGITDADLDRKVSPDTIPGTGELSVREVLELLRSTYCRSIGAQFMHIDDLEVRKWLQGRMERSQNRLQMSREEQLRILTKLTQAVIFEDFIQKKYVGVKSFSLEGGESLIPLLDLAIEKAGSQGIVEIVMGMAHRGRLNVLANVIGKNPRTIFREFDDVDAEMHRGRGDVKYHLGHSGDWVTQSGKKVHLSLCFNPSHLEFVNPVVLGRMRAKQDRAGDDARRKGMALIIHGDASFAGEGVVQETLNLSELEGYQVGGALHVVVNNQLGFTTSPHQGRSSTYATDVAKMLQSPIFHVNGEDPEAVAQVVNLAMDFRETFQRDVVIDMYCYRRYGHNEGDEPSFTQPLMYQAIQERPSVREGYVKRLLKLGEITRDEADQIADEHRAYLENELSVARGDDFKPHYSAFEGLWSNYQGGEDEDAPEVDTGVDQETLSALLKAQMQLPENFTPHRKLSRGFKLREEMAEGERPLDWAAAEILALASLAAEGYRVRVSGQDSERGTFSHRHAVLHDVETGERHMALQHLDIEQGPVDIINSPLSEAGVLGFEYGYSLDWPDGLVAWEAQFGDFCNAAQVIIDQFIASAEDKWRRLSGLTMLLPHGFEGQGPEHSSARLERFLMLCADDNMQIVNPTTPAQYFHVLRRQVLRPWRKPLIIMTPKSLLRHAKVISPLEDLTEGHFRRILTDPHTDPQQVKRVLICSGKVYYDLAAEREELGRDDVAILRLEQLYPLSDSLLHETFAPYADGTQVFWVQEEPENMGAWRTLRVRFGEQLFGRLPFSGVSRPASASPATGSASAHKLEQRELIKAAFATSGEETS